MRICLFADIHGNGPACFESLRSIVAEKANVNIFLGDLCGYYYDQIEILDTLNAIPNLISIKGNHDEMFLQIASGNLGLRGQYLERYGHCMENLLVQNNSALKAWLEQLEFSYCDQERGFVCFHGSPLNPQDGYVYPDASLECFGSIPERFVFLGHTHYRMHRVCCGVHFINPGSLGQPRGGGLPTYAVVDTNSCEIVFREFVFDKSVLRERIKAMGDENVYLDTVLSRW